MSAAIIREASAIGSGVDEKNHSLSAAMGYQVYGLPTPLVEQINQAMPPFKYETNPTICY